MQFGNEHGDADEIKGVDQAVPSGECTSYMLGAEKEGNKFILKEIPGEKIENVSDGYHTFGELYKHRHHLFIAFAKLAYNETDSLGMSGFNPTVRSKVHEDGLDVWNEWGMFLLCVHTPLGQISYHIPNEYWDKCDFAITEEQATIPWDGHTSEDVLNRLLKI